MHGYGYASVLRNRIAVSFFCGCFLPVALVEACLPFVLCDKVFYAEMCLITNESVWPYPVAFPVVSLTITTTATITMPSFSYLCPSRALWKCDNVHQLLRSLFYWKLTFTFCLYKRFTYGRRFAPGLEKWKPRDQSSASFSPRAL